MGRPAIGDEKIAEVLRVYAETGSQRITAARCSVSRSLVQKAVQRRHVSQTGRAPAKERRHIDPGQVAAAKRAVAAVGNRKEAARLLGLPREFVRRAANGEFDGEAPQDLPIVRGDDCRPILNPGEVYVVAQNCGQGHWVEVLPCRICLQQRITRAQQVLDRLREVNEQAAAFRATGGEPSHRRMPRVGRREAQADLDLQLEPAAQARLEEVRRGRMSHEADSDGG